MENPEVPRSSAITYALLSLLVRFIAAQSDVIDLWYSRRCYERSRGEMIVMLYEKTLSRKIVGDLDNTPSGESDQTTDKDTSSDSKSPWRNCGWRNISLCMKSKDSKEKSKKPASMGKILNLMR